MVLRYTNRVKSIARRYQNVVNSSRISFTDLGILVHLVHAWHANFLPHMEALQSCCRIVRREFSAPPSCVDWTAFFLPHCKAYIRMLCTTVLVVINPMPLCSLEGMEHVSIANVETRSQRPNSREPSCCTPLRSRERPSSGRCFEFWCKKENTRPASGHRNHPFTSKL